MDWVLLLLKFATLAISIVYAPLVIALFIDRLNLNARNLSVFGISTSAFICLQWLLPQ